MFQIGKTLVSLDVVERCFVCDLASCKGNCCVDGDAGAPLLRNELAELQNIVPVVWNDLLPEAKAVIERQGVAYLDIDGEMVTSIVNDKDCVFTCYDADGICKCAIEKAYNEGRTPFRKPVSCHLYPVRIRQYDNYQAVNYDRRRMCRCAEALGARSKTPVYRFLKEPLIRQFGQEWYDELALCAGEWKKQAKPG